MIAIQKYFPWIVCILGLSLVAVKAIPPQPKGANGVDYNAIGQLPVMDDGRLKPLDTVARTSLLAISESEEYKDLEGNKQPAIRWLLDVMSQDKMADKHQVFRITNDQVLNFLELPRKPGFYRYSIEEIQRNGNKLKRELYRVQKMPPKKQELFHEKILELGQRLKMHEQIEMLRTPQFFPVERQEAWDSLAQVDEKIVQPIQGDLRQEAIRRVLDNLEKAGKRLEQLSPEQQESVKDLVENVYQSFRRQTADEERPKANPSAEVFHDILRSYASGDAVRFNQLVGEFRQSHHGNMDSSKSNRIEYEWYFNHFSPFYVAAILYVFVIGLACLGWLVWPKQLQTSAFCLACVALAVHTFGLLSRMYLQGRPPVTNLYASAVFIGWGGVVLCLIIERIYRNGLGNILAAIVGASTVKIALGLAESLALGERSDTLQPLVAVLDTNFWLATHVTSVTLGYTATYVAAIIGIYYILAGVFTPRLDAATNKTLGQMLYGVICFATFLSFVGTVLGGIWADQSWGRFWGWDPKENGAVLIVIWNALVLHARWAGLAKLRGMAVLSVVGAMITTWSWFGTNQLGVGLHAYGFDKSLADGCRYTWIICLVIIGIGNVPLRYWRSFSEANKQGSAPKLKKPAASSGIS